MMMVYRPNTKPITIQYRY